MYHLHQKILLLGLTLQLQQLNLRRYQLLLDIFYLQFLQLLELLLSVRMYLMLAILQLFRLVQLRQYLLKSVFLLVFLSYQNRYLHFFKRSNQCCKCTFKTHIILKCIQPTKIYCIKIIIDGFSSSYLNDITIFS